MYIDFHTHCFPDKIANRAVEKLSFVSGGLHPYTDGSLSGLKASMKEGNVDISVVLSIATNAHQQQSVNDFAAQINEDEGIIAFGSVFPDAPDALDELDRIKSMGLKGIKLHPDYQGFFVDDDKMIPIYKKISALGLITVFHAGFDYGFPPPYKATPDRMAKILKYFDTPIVAAHWGGANCGDDVLKYLAGKEIYFDTAFGYGQMPKYYAQKIMELHTPDRILFGTDTPWHTPDMEKTLLSTLGISTEDMEKITHKNAQKLLGI